MNKIFKVLFSVAIFGVIASCGSGSSGSLSYYIQIQNGEDLVFEDANIKVKLYGTDRRVADNYATVISETILDLDNVPSIITLNWPENDYQLISDPPVRAPEDAIYYLDITIDSNSDGVLCGGEYAQDYDLTPFATIDEKPTETLVIYVKSIDSDICREF